MTKLRGYRPIQHKFTGEFRVMVNRQKWPKMTQDILWEMLTQIINDGQEFDGIKVLYFDVRGKEISRDQYAEYGFVHNADTIKAIVLPHQKSKTRS